jgi:hypothetical protein
MSNITHSEWSIENSLSAPEDRVSTIEAPWRPDQTAPPLTNDETNEALKELSNTAFIAKFPKVERTYADPVIPNQSIGLISFVPAKGAKPNENGIYGFAKLRGNYANIIESNQRAEFLIRNIDSYHQIYHTYIGRPFPLTLSSKYSSEVDEVDIRKQTAESISADVKQKKLEEKNEIQEIKNREERLLEDSRKAQKDEPTSEDDIYEKYITLQVKKAQLTWTYLEHQKKMKEIKDILVDTRHELVELDIAEPTFKDKYFEKYQKAREVAGLKNETKAEVEDNFMKFMIEDASIPEIDELYQTKYGSSKFEPV